MERIGVIGGTGLYLMEGFEDVRTEEVVTPFGHPSDPPIVGRLGGVEVVFIPRHGRGHRFSPSELPYRANVAAMKMLGVTRIFSVSAVGSMKEEIALTVPVLVDQFIDRTHLRASTFFGDGLVAHVSMADPTCPSLRALLAARARASAIPFHEGGTYVCMEGPQFSSRAESMMYRQIGVDVIGMTNATEAKLAREAEICYATIALPTDYDCWHTGHEDVSVGSVVERLDAGTSRAKALILDALAHLGEAAPCGCRDAADGAIITARDRITPAARERLMPIAGRHL
ncbi:MAG: S-methyl-5'-thioadenosine phosphorylase [Deltaproteobacteria bacterium]|nr:S-methyl-5'-thioadenosine phosphorylase [Deltaproteobacteria bacterium]